ncbi:MAG: hypothetical protein RLO52_08670 [Sandaracinaceae bacterium]|nr:MAG: hypothetical protein EVA89_31530 [Sandaracinaceae bacterium]HBQ19885.1 hypothetical protein [Myxococcales bacterium]
MRRATLVPLAWGFGIGLGAAVAIAAGPWLMSWGGALGFVALSVILSAGAVLEKDGDGLTSFFRFALGFTLGFLALSVPLTWTGLNEMATRADAVGLEQIELARAMVVPRWAIAYLAFFGGVIVLWLRRGRQAR